MSPPRHRLLIVAARAGDREAYREMLGQDAFELVEATRGDEGLALCGTHPPDCVLLDPPLADMDAPEFLAALVAGGTEAPVPVVVITPRHDGVHAARAMKAGARGYLVRGFDPAELRGALQTAMERHARLSNRVYRVLLVDDSPEDRASYRRRLERGADRFEFAEAETGEEGLARCRSFEPDCVLLDYNLPDTDGLEVLTTLLHERGDMAVLLLTGQGSESVAVQALKAGAEDYLVKGPALEGLPQAVRAAVERATLRRRLEAQRRELERSQNQLRVTLASIGDAVIATDLAGRVTFMNPVAEALTGWSAEAANGRPLADVFVTISEDTRLPTENPALRALREGRVVGLANHALLLARDGTQRAIDDSAAPIRDAAGAVFGAVLVFRDVTERYRVERSLVLQSQVLDSMTEGVSVTDEAGVTFYTNPAEDRMFGHERGELLGRPITERDDDPPEENERRMLAVRQQLADGGVWTGEWRNRRKDGSTFTSHARITSLVAAGRRCVVRVQEDVSDRHRLEDELQQRVTELALAHRRKDEFLAMLAHELRNPLTPIKNALHILGLRRGDEHTVDRMREVMERQVRHFGRLVDDLLDVSRVTQGKLTLRPERLDLGRLVRDCVADHQAEFERAKISLTAETSATPVWISGDTTRLTQVVDNLLNNALKFTNPGGAVSVQVVTDGASATLTVTDDGVGIEPEVLPTVFDVFAQADKSLARSPGGLGLGLAIVQGLVQLHGGAVAARSEGLGRGTRMIVTLPLEREPAALIPVCGARAEPGGRRRILVIEDNRDSAESLRMLLEVSGYTVKLAHTGTEGVRVAVAWRPDAVICDIGLPEMDGFSVARALRSDPATAGVYLMAVTGYGRAQDVAEAQTAGFDEHLMKPADPHRLLAKLASLATARVE